MDPINFSPTRPMAPCAYTSIPVHITQGCNSVHLLVFSIMSSFRVKDDSFIGLQWNIKDIWKMQSILFYNALAAMAMDVSRNGSTTHLDGIFQ